MQIFESHIKNCLSQRVEQNIGIKMNNVHHHRLNVNQKHEDWGGLAFMANKKGNCLSILLSKFTH